MVWIASGGNDEFLGGNPWKLMFCVFFATMILRDSEKKLCKKMIARKRRSLQNKKLFFFVFLGSSLAMVIDFMFIDLATS